MRMKKYVSPKINVIKIDFEKSDIIQTSTEVATSTLTLKSDVGVGEKTYAEVSTASKIDLTK